MALKRDIYSIFNTTDIGEVYDRLCLKWHYCDMASKRYDPVYMPSEKYQGSFMSAYYFVKGYLNGKAKIEPGRKDSVYYLIDENGYKHVFNWQRGMITLITVYRPNEHI